MKKIQLNKKKGVQGFFALVDDDDYERVNKYNWSFARFSNLQYASTDIIHNGAKKTIRMHRFILGLEDSKSLVDHRDGNGLNNQRNNIRIATHTQNMTNRRSVGASKYIGVCLRSGERIRNTDKIWQSSIRTCGRRKYIGVYATEEDAARAYDEQAKIHHGEFANLNFKEQ